MALLGKIEKIDEIENISNIENLAEIEKENALIKKDRHRLMTVCFFVE